MQVDIVDWLMTAEIPGVGSKWNRSRLCPVFKGACSSFRILFRIIQNRSLKEYYPINLVEPDSLLKVSSMQQSLFSNVYCCNKEVNSGTHIFLEPFNVLQGDIISIHTELHFNSWDIFIIHFELSN